MLGGLKQRLPTLCYHQIALPSGVRAHPEPGPTQLKRSLPTPGVAQPINFTYFHLANGCRFSTIVKPIKLMEMFCCVAPMLVTAPALLAVMFVTLYANDIDNSKDLGDLGARTGKLNHGAFQGLVCLLRLSVRIFCNFLPRA